MEVLIEKAAEKVVERPQTFIEKFWDNLEKATDINLTEKSQQYHEVATFWDDLVSDNMTDVNETSRPLTDEEKVNYKEKLGCSDHLLDNATIDDNGKINIKTINEGKEGQEGENGVKYERKIIIVNGVEVEGVFPVFDSAFDTQLPEDLLKATDKNQNEYCNQELKEAVENDPELAKQFTPEQLEQIKNGETPDGYTWHHNEETGKMQLVKTEDHQANRHTGGKSIWGGGKENR
jgi:hypothetical protein